MLRFRGLMAGLLACSFCFLAGTYVTGADEKPASGVSAKEQEYYELMKILVDSFEQVERNYVKDVDRRKLVEAALKGMLEELDPYSNYISPEELARFKQQVEQEFGGIGIQVTTDNPQRRLQVMTPLPGTPAYKAGIRSGDLIMEIEGKSTEGVTIDQAVRLLKGKPGSAVNLGVQHVGTNKIEKVHLVRAMIHVSTVLGDSYKKEDQWNFMLDSEKKIGYLRLTAFSRNSSQEMKEALNQLRDEGMKALIVDLRFNPGGLLNVATEIADLFLEDGVIVSTKGRNSPERVTTAKKPNTFSGFPMVVLVNRYSASASEIVSAALQDHNRAIVVGERTWGKGSVQNMIDLEEGKSALKLTTAAYFRPSGKNIHRFPGAKESDEWGVMPNPNFVVQMDTPEMQKYLEYRRARDVIQDAPPKSDFIDRQLNKAVEYLTSQLAAPVTKVESKDDAKTNQEADAKKDEARKDEPKKADGKKDDVKKEDVKKDEGKKDASKKDASKSKKQPGRTSLLPERQALPQDVPLSFPQAL